MANREYHDVQIFEEFTQASTRANLTSQENLAISLGKLSKWYEALVPTGGSSGQFLGWNSSGTAQWVSNPNTTYALSGEASSSTYVITLTPSTGTATTATVPAGSTSAYGLVKLSSSTSSSSTSLAATPSAVKSAYDLASSKSSVSFAQSLSSGTKIGEITIDGTSTDVYCETNTDTVTTATTTGSGNAITSVTALNGALTFTKGSTFSLSDHTHNNYLGAVKIGDYWGMAYPDGTAADKAAWIRTTYKGILPYAANSDATNGLKSELGSSTWTFVSGYINDIYYKDLKTITVVAGNTADNSIDKMAGSYFYSGSNLFNAGESIDWVGIQAGYSADKWQIMGNGDKGVLYRQNDTGGTDTSNWNTWARLMTPSAVTGSGGITATISTETIGTGANAYTINGGLNISHTNSVTETTDFNKPYVKYDAQGHVTESKYWQHKAIGTNNAAGWVKVATFKHIMSYDNTPIVLNVSQRGQAIFYKLHLKWVNGNTVDPDIYKFILSIDDTPTTPPRAYIKKSDTSTWDLYILKLDMYDSITISGLFGGYFTDHMELTWTDVQVADADITGGTEATRATVSKSGTLNRLAYYSDTDQISSSNNLAYKADTSAAQTPADRGILHIFSSGTVGNDAAKLISGVQGLLSYGDGGPQINFSTATTVGGGQDSAIIWTDHDKAALGASWHFVSSQADWNVISKRFHARTAISIGTDLPVTDYNLYVNGTSFCDGDLTLHSASGDSPALIFQRGTLSDNYNDWKVYDSDGSLYFDRSNSNASTWSNKVYISDTEINTVCNMNCNKASGTTGYFANRTDTSVSVSLQVGSGGYNHGVYSNTVSAWLVNFNQNNEPNIYSVNKEYDNVQSSNYCIPFFGATAGNGSKALYHNNGLRYTSKNGTSSSGGNAYLLLGNESNTSTAGNKQGVLRLYTANTGYVDIKTTSSTSNRTITMPNASGTVALNRYCFITGGNTEITDSNGWYKFADITLTSKQWDQSAKFLITHSWSDNSGGTAPSRSGILIAHVRTDNSIVGKINENSCELRWLIAGNRMDINHFKMIHYDTEGTSTRVELWCRSPGRYSGWYITELQENTRVGSTLTEWTLYSANAVAGSAFPSSGYTGNVFTSAVQTLLAGTV